MDKFPHYLLDPDNVQNRGKAEWFRQALGFDKSNWQQLAAQVRFDEESARLQRVGPFGEYYEQVIPIAGANGRTMDVRFKFLKDRDGIVSLTTALPSKK